MIELRAQLVKSGKLDNESIDTFLAHCADPNWWTQTIAFTAVHARSPSGCLRDQSMCQNTAPAAHTIRLLIHLAT